MPNNKIPSDVGFIPDGNRRWTVPREAALLIVGDETSLQFPIALKEFRQRQGVGMKVNLLVNYGWQWNLAGLKRRQPAFR